MLIMLICRITCRYFFRIRNSLLFLFSFWRCGLDSESVYRFFALYFQSLQAVRSSDLKPYIIFIRPPPPAPPQQPLPTRVTKGGKKHKGEDVRDVQERTFEMENNYGHLFDAVIINSDLNQSVCELLKLVKELDTEPQWVPYTWLC